MRIVFAAVVALAVNAAATGAASATEAHFSDVICPEATQYVLALGKLRTVDAPQQIYDATQRASEAYARCSSQKLANGFREAQHYADVRSAQFGVVAARALIALGRREAARAELLRCRALAQNVADWFTETEAFQSADRDGHAVTVNSDHRPSMYRVSAREIVESADEALSELDAARRDVPRRQTGEPAPTATRAP